MVDGLERALKFTKRLSLGWASAVSTWLAQFRGSQGDSYWRHALGEQDFRNRRAKHIIYGHTHASEMVSLDASYAEGYVHNQVYLNSGTWRRVHRQTLFAPNEHEFIASDSMTYLAFFQGDERGGRPYESWSGTLGVNFPERKILRVDPAHSAVRRPHVAAPPSRSNAPERRTAVPIAAATNRRRARHQSNPAASTGTSRTASTRRPHRSIGSSRHHTHPPGRMNFAADWPRWDRRFDRRMWRRSTWSTGRLSARTPLAC